MEGKSCTCTARKTDLKMIGVASFLLLLTAAAVEGRNDDEQIFAYVGQRLELCCKREKDCDVSKISWLKDGHILHRLCFKEDSDVGLVLNESFVTLVIPNVKESDAGVYQCGSPRICLIKLTVLKILTNTLAESSDDKCNSTLQNMLSGIYSLQRDVKGYILIIIGNILFNSVLLIICTLIIGIGTVIFYKWWKGKYKDQECEAPLIESDAKTLLSNQLKPYAEDFKAALCKLEDIMTGMVKPNDGLGNELTNLDLALHDRFNNMLRTMQECTRQCEEFGQVWGSAATNINRLEDDFYAHRDMAVNQLKLHDKDIKYLKQRVQQSQITSVNGQQVCESDNEPHGDN